MSTREPFGGDDLLRDLVAGEREALAPRPGARDATWTAVMQSVGEGATPPIDAKEIPGPLAASGGVASWLKIIVALALGGAVVVGVVAATGGGAREPPRAAERVVAAEQPEERTEPPVVERIEEDTGAIEPVEATGAIEPAPQAIEPIGAGVAADHSPSTTIGKREGRNRAHARASEPQLPAPAEPAASTLAEEAKLLAAARRALGRGAHADALAKLAEHARRFADGQLAEDRVALRARVHCDRGDLEQGRRAAAELRRANPRSSQLARIDRECKARG